MDFNESREKAVAERMAGANKVLDRIRDETGIDKDKLTWVDSFGGYRLRVFVGGDKQDFNFSNRGLEDYTSDRPNPSVDSTIDTIIRWIKDRTT